MASCFDFEPALKAYVQPRKNKVISQLQLWPFSWETDNNMVFSRDNTFIKFEDRMITVR